MITVLDAINLSEEYLQKKGIESARINAELLLAFALKCKRLELYLSYDRPLKQKELNNYRELIKRRSNFEPLQYITGSVEFYELEFKVTPAVLIPRPETEILIETIINNCKEKKAISILDIGCGSGIIGISLAKYLPGAKIFCTDISEKAIKLSKQNASARSVESNIVFKKHDIVSQQIDFLEEVDVIVSNPPYISKTDFQSLQKEIKNFEPRYALTDESDGFSFFNIISSKASQKLKTGGRLFFEVSDGQVDSVKKILMENSFKEINIVKDYQNIDRVIFGAKK